MTTVIPRLLEYSEDAIEQAFASLESDFNADSQESHIASSEDLDDLRRVWAGRKDGLLKQASDAWLPAAPAPAKRHLGIAFNALKKHVEAGIAAAALRLTAAPTQAFLDITLPGAQRRPGAEHPLIRTMDEIVAVFTRMGYSTRTGPEVETDFNNFESLNFPPNHPARDTQDTLVIAGQETKPLRERLLMRTHTSPVQIRSMLAEDPPLRLVIPGKVHRNEAADATHSPVFHQVEGLCVGDDITFSDLKGTLDHAMKSLFGSAMKTRFFPSFFPFTEPSADVQVTCIFCGGRGCRKCKHSGWIELLGCGMVDPAVFAAVNARRIELGRDPVYDPDCISGFAFGMGVDRIAIMKYGITDISLLYSGDARFLEQFV